MAISRPMLPPLRGYVEVEVDGVRRYKNAETGYLLGEEPPPDPDAQAATWGELGAAYTKGVNEA